jgi:hypothetical protein
MEFHDSVIVWRIKYKHMITKDDNVVYLII